MRYLCPHWVTFLGLAALSAASMSTADSCILAASSVFTTNIYKGLLRPKASDREMLWVIRTVIIIVGTIGCILSVIGNSVYLFNIISHDLVYVTLFPQLVCILHFPSTNIYGGIVGYLVALLCRYGGGEPMIGLPGFINYPGNYTDDNGQDVRGFPVKTFAMLCDFVATISVSWFTRFLFRRGLFPKKIDIGKAFQNQNDTKPSDQTSTGTYTLERSHFLQESDREDIL